MSTIWTILLVILAIIIALFLLTSLTGAPYVPTLHKNLDKNLHQLYPLKKTDFLIDLGSGDGVILQMATQHGARALGIEINPILALITKMRFRRQSKVQIKCRNFYRVQFPQQTTVIYAFAVSTHINKIYQKIQNEANRLGKTLYFISNAFTVAGKRPVKQAGTFLLYKITPEKQR